MRAARPAPRPAVGRRTWLAAGLALTLGGCAAAPPEPPPRASPEIGFAGQPSIGLAVERIETVVQPLPPEAPPYVGHLFPDPIAEAARRWGAQRLRATAGNGRVARYIVVEASAVEESLPRSEGLAGALGRGPSERYDLAMELRLEIFDANGARLGYATARGEYSKAVPEGLGPDERRRVWQRMLGQFMEDMDVEMEGQIRTELAPFIQPAATVDAARPALPGFMPGIHGTPSPASSANPVFHGLPGQARQMQESARRWPRAPCPTGSPSACR